MYLFPVICPTCTFTFEGGNNVRCPRCDEPDDMHTALTELRRDVEQLNAERFAYVTAAVPGETRAFQLHTAEAELERFRHASNSYSRVTSCYARRGDSAEIVRRFNYQRWEITQ